MYQINKEMMDKNKKIMKIININIYLKIINNKILRNKK
jgi:hypothetical protein